MSATNRMTDQEIADFIAHFITGKDADKIAAMIYDAYGQPEDEGDPGYPEIPKGGIVEKFVGADYGEIVREDIVKLTLLLKGYFEGKAIETSGYSSSAASALEVIREISDHIQDIIGNAREETGLEWRYGFVREDGHVTVSDTQTRSIVTTEIARDSKTLMIEYTGESYNGDKPYFVHLAQYRAGTPDSPTFISRTTLHYAPGNIHNIVTLDDDCAGYVYVIGYLVASGDQASMEDADNFAAVVYEDKAEAIKDEIEQLSNKIFGELVKGPDASFTAGSVLAESQVVSSGVRRPGKILNSSIYVRNTVPISVSGHKYIHLPTPVTGLNPSGGGYPYGVALYSAGLFDGDVIAETPEDYFVKGYTNAYRSIYGYEWKTIAIPETAAWMIVTYWGNPSTYGAPAFQFYFADNYEEGTDYAARHASGSGADPWLVEEARRLGLHTVPENESQLNIVRRCRQMTDIEWTPAVDLPRFNMITRTPGYTGPGSSVNVRNTFGAGVTYKGLPYTKCKDTSSSAYVYEHEKYNKSDFYVGFGISLETFVTAVKNESSLLCVRGTELLEYEHDHPDDTAALAAHVGTVYGIVCSALASYALGLTAPVTSANLANISGLVRMTPEGSGLNGTLSDWWHDGELDDKLNLGDILNYSGVHSIVVTDIVKDASGKIVCVELSEATTPGNGNEDVLDGPDGGICRRKGFEPKDMIDRFGADYAVLRYMDVVPYSMDANTRLQGEPEGFRLTDLPVMPYEGSRFEYRKSWLSGNAIKFIISTAGYNRVLIYKTTDPSTPVQSVSVNPTDTSVEVDASSYAVGNYAVCLALYSGLTEDHRTAVSWFSITN